VYYGLIPDAEQQAGAFGVPFVWDIPLLEGYPWEALPSARKRPSLGSFFGNSTPRILERLAADRPEVLILTGWNSWPLVQGWRAGRRLGIPMLIRCEANAMRRRPFWVRAIHRGYLKAFRGFLAIGEGNRRFYEGYGVPAAKIWKAPYFIDNTRVRGQYESKLPERTSLRERWKVPLGAFCFLYVGKLEPKKRLPDLLQALAVAKVASPRSLHLLVVGSGELMEQAREMVETQKLPVSFAGFLNQTQLSDAYAAGDCLVLPSDYGETWGLVVNEAMVCGLPVIVSDRVGSGPDLVAPGETGEVFPFADVGALADRILRMASNDDAATAMGEKARLRVAPYSAEAAVHGTLEAIAAVAGAR
jgi:glycosyltransferase involved in cell wall biosynthesis